MTKGRLEAFCDGVFAVAITLLILDVRPEQTGRSGWEMLMHDWHHILVFVLSFVIVGVYWVAHHHFLHFIAATDRVFLWINLLLLLLVVFIPYVAGLLSATHADPSSIRIYASTLTLINLTGSVLWFYATNGQLLVSKSLPPDFARFVLVLHTAPVLVYAIAAGIASWWPVGSLCLFVLVPVFFILPNPYVERRIRLAASAIHSPEKREFRSE